MIAVEAYGCVTASGSGVDAFWQGLKRGHIAESPVPFSWRVPPRNTLNPRACLIPQRQASFKDRLTDGLTTSFQELKEKAQIDSSLAIIFCSTKGCVEDYIWKDKLAPEEMGNDPYEPVLESFIERNELSPVRAMCISNACASSLAGLFLARMWIEQGVAKQVLLLAGDLIGEFTFHGFDLLNAMSPTQCRPFSGDRDGLRLGDACAALLLSTRGPVVVDGVGLDTEGFAVSRPNTSGDSLIRAFKRLPSMVPDLIVAHGTGTKANDVTEDNAFSKLFATSCATATKWSVGHTLGASGAIDIIAACEVVERQDVFAIETTSAVDTNFRGNYLRRGSNPSKKWTRVLVSSLGFGGTHALASLRASTS